MQWAREKNNGTLEESCLHRFVKIKISGSDGHVFVLRKTTKEWLPLVHRANVVTLCIRKNGTPILDWLAQSPDLKPFGNLWMVLKKADLKTIAEKEWKKL